MILFVNIAVLALVALGAWWLTGLDKTGGGDSKRGHYFTRVLRCVAVLLLVAAFLSMIENPALGAGGIPLLLIIPVSIALVLRSSVAELLTGGFLRLLDPTLADNRPFDPGQTRRCQDAIARLIQQGRRNEAIKLCEELKQSGEVDRTMLEHTLEFLGVPQATAKTKSPLAQAARLRAGGQFTDAEKLLRAALAKNPADIAAAMMLMRVLAQDLRQAGKAREILRGLEQQPDIPASHLEFARRSMDEWSGRRVEAVQPAAPEPRSVDELIAQGFFGSAVERLEEQIQAQPDDFDLRMKLAEIFAVNCKDFQRADKIVQRIQLSAQFSPAQIECAQGKLAAWRRQVSQLERNSSAN